MKENLVGLLSSLSLAIMVCGHTITQPRLAHAQTISCAAASGQVPFPNAARALVGWERARNIQLTATARDGIWRKFCSGARQVSDQLGVGQTDIEQISEKILMQYLDDNLTGRRSVTSLVDLIGGELALGAAPTLPEPKELGLINIIYRQKPEFIVIGNTSMRPWPTLLAQIGTLAISGTASNRIVCQGTVAVSPIAPVDFQC